MASCGAPRREGVERAPREGAVHELRELFFQRCQVLASVARAAMNAPTWQGKGRCAVMRESPGQGPLKCPQGGGAHLHMLLGGRGIRGDGGVRGAAMCM